jgi:hypothetical protein
VSQEPGGEGEAPDALVRVAAGSPGKRAQEGGGTGDLPTARATQDGVRGGGLKQSRDGEGTEGDQEVAEGARLGN